MNKDNADQQSSAPVENLSGCYVVNNVGVGFCLQSSAPEASERDAFEKWAQQLNIQLNTEPDQFTGKTYKDFTTAFCWSAWQAARQARPCVPDGWKLVPLLPTSEMVCALMSSMLETENIQDDTHCIVIALAHAIDAAPSFGVQSNDSDRKE